MLNIFFLVSIEIIFYKYLLVGGNQISCSTSDGLNPLPNLCAEVRDINGKPLPNCINNGSDEEPSWVCSECSHNCDCPIGQYCPKGPGQFSGTCRDISSDDKIGRGCIIFGTPNTYGAEIPVYGYNDDLVCGAPIFYKNGTFNRYDWLGACVEGICQECDGGSLSWIMASATTSLIPSINTVKIGEGYYGHLARDGGSLLCLESICKSGEIVKNEPSVLDVIPTGVSITILCFVILIYIMLCCICCAKYLKNKSPGNVKNLFHRRKRKNTSQQQPIIISQRDFDGEMETGFENLKSN